ncbi:MAG: group I truncated hemoglobin [Phycisphaerae bacterium]
MATIYEQIGGEKSIDAAVERFYRKVLGDERISRFFDDVEMQTQMSKQRAFLTMVLGGPNNYTGRDMRSSHERLVAMGLNDEHFDAVVEHLGRTLAELGVPANLIAQIASIAESVRNDVLNRDSSPVGARG